MYIIIYISTAARASSLQVHSLGDHISCHCLLYINIVISVHCTWDFGPPNLLYISCTNQRAMHIGLRSSNYCITCIVSYSFTRMGEG